VLSFAIELIRKTGGEYLTLLEVKTLSEFEIVNACYSSSDTFKEIVRAL
jgi:hypothetical protein